MTITTEKPTNSVPIYLFSKEEFASWISGASDEAKQWVSREGFTANAGQVCTLPNEVGGLAAVLVGKEADYEARWTLARVAAKLKLGA
ncbi:MAG: leucyl aminopeptidase family protein, partial [Alphaproteobacteria bacterium]